MSKTVKQISKIKLKDSGLKGLEVTYTYPQEKDNYIWANEHIEKRKHPIHTDLGKAINDLRHFLLEGAGYFTHDLSKSEKDYLIEDCKVVEVQMNNEMFKLSGVLRTVGDKDVKVTTPKIEMADGYENFEAVAAILRTVIAETMEYMAGKKKLDESAYLMQYAKQKNDEALIKDFASMSNKEIKDKCTEILEKMGGIVLINEELDVNEVKIDFTTSEEDIEEEATITGNVEVPKEAIQEMNKSLHHVQVVTEPKPELQIAQPIQLPHF